ncbi:MAG: hypothetical protein ABIB79_03260 [archaeon]
MQKDKLKNWEKKAIIAQAVFIAGVFVYLFFSTMPNQVYPLQGMVISEPDFVFEIENGEQVVISMDEAFNNEIVLGEGADITLPSGTYFWKVRSEFRESEVQSFIIEGRVGLDLKERELSYKLENSGNVDLNVTQNNEEVIGNFDLYVGESIDVEKDGSRYEGGQK